MKYKIRLRLIAQDSKAQTPIAYPNHLDQNQFMKAVKVIIADGNG